MEYRQLAEEQYIKSIEKYHSLGSHKVYCLHNKKIVIDITIFWEDGFWEYDVYDYYDEDDNIIETDKIKI